TARRAGQELAKGDDVGIACFVEPFATGDELVAEIAEMGDRAAERGQPELEKRREHLPRRPARQRFAARRVIARHDRTRVKAKTRAAMQATRAEVKRAVALNLCRLWPCRPPDESPCGSAHRSRNGRDWSLRGQSRDHWAQAVGRAGALPP